MSDRPTPETDAVIYKIDSKPHRDSIIVDLLIHARKLERQRDEARESEKAAHEAWVAAKKERDELRELARELRDALKKCAGVCSGEVLSKNSLIDALESARTALTKAKEVLHD